MSSYPDTVDVNDVIAKAKLAHPDSPRRQFIAAKGYADAVLRRALLNEGEK